MSRVEITTVDDKIDLVCGSNDNRLSYHQPRCKFVQVIMSKQVKPLIILAFLFINCLIIFGGITLLVIETSPKDETVPHQSQQIIYYTHQHKLITPDEWGGRELLPYKELLHKAPDLVIISHTATINCSTILECSEIVKNIQAYHIDGLNNSDVAYNFLIGGDGNIYEGRGWNFINSHRNNSISVCFIGNYVTNDANENMIEALEFLLMQGIQYRKLDEHFRIICHNQTSATLSPGENIYKIISKMERFSSENYRKKPLT